MQIIVLGTTLSLYSTISHNWFKMHIFLGIYDPFSLCNCRYGFSNILHYFQGSYYALLNVN